MVHIFLEYIAVSRYWTFWLLIRHYYYVEIVCRIPKIDIDKPIENWCNNILVWWSSSCVVCAPKWVCRQLNSVCLESSYFEHWIVTWFMQWLSRVLVHRLFYARIQS